MKVGAVLCICLSGFLCSPALATHRKAGATDAIDTALSQCLGSFSPKISVSSDPDAVPPGLIEGKGVSIALVDGTDSRVFSYQGTERRVSSCGIAIYGPVTSAVRDFIQHDIEAHAPKWAPRPTNFYDLSSIPALKGIPGRETYWGDPSAPGMIGVAMLERKPSAAAPTVEVEYHSVLVQ